MDDIPELVTHSLELLPGESASLGLHIRQGPDDLTEILEIVSDGPAARSELKVGFRILSVNDHRVGNAEKCAELLKHYATKKARIEILASAGPLPAGALYVLCKAGKKPIRPILDDGSLQGLFLKEEKRGAVRVKTIGQDGIFANARINKRDILLAIDGRKVHTIKDCEHALKNASRNVVPILTYNVFRKLRSTIVVSSTSKILPSTETNDGSILIRRSASELYDMGVELGSGAFGTVVLCKSKISGVKYAMKIVNRASLSTDIEKALRHEVVILNELDHPNIMSLVETFSTIKAHYLVTELLEGGELFDRIIEKATYNESEARDLSSTLFKALAYCHEKHVCHRDLKPENILLKSKDDDTQIKIADFGMARKAPNEDSLLTLCGSPYYIAPEILLRQRYGVKADIWSIGVIIFILLGGYPPFSSENRATQDKMIVNCKYEFLEDYWGSVSGEAKALISSLLVIDPRKRLSAMDALRQPWFGTDRNLLRKNSLESSQRSMESYFATDRLRSAVEKVIAMNRLRRKLSDTSESPRAETSSVLNSVFSEKQYKRRASNDII